MKRRIPIFFASDDNYLPYLAVALQSISDNGSDDNIYDVKVLTGGISREAERELISMHLPRLEVEIVNVDEAMAEHRDNLNKRLRDYYSESIFYRIFIASMYPELDRAIYLDCDIVVVDDIAKLYDEELSGCILGAVADESIPGVPEFCRYVEGWVGVEVKNYINSGILLIDLKEFRAARIEENITELAATYNFDTVAPDQDYLNFLCSGRIKYLSYAWNKQPKADNVVAVDELHLIHYNMFNKPWHYARVPYAGEFWKYAEKTPFYDRIRRGFEGYGRAERMRDKKGAVMLLANAERLAHSKCGFSSLCCAGLGTKR